MSKRHKYGLLSDQLVFEVVHLYVEEEVGATEIDRRLESKFAQEWNEFELSKESIVHIVHEAISRGWVILNAPLEGKLATALRLGFREVITEDKDVQVVNVGLSDAIADEQRTRSSRSSDHPKRDDARPKPGDAATKRPRTSLTDHVSHIAASTVLRLIKEVAEHKAGSSEPVRIGLGAGYTAKQVIRRLGGLLRREEVGAKLAIHALTPGFSSDPLEAPVTYFRFFEGIKDEIEYVGLFTSGFATEEEFERLKNDPETAEVFKLAQELDIVVSSLGSAEDKHSFLVQYLSGKNAPAGELERMKSAGWKGDVQFMPYSSNSPLQLRHKRPVTLLDLNDLRAMRNRVNEKKFVVLCAAPCIECQSLKTNALLPVIGSKQLDVWTHLVCDRDTAQGCIDAVTKPASSRAVKDA